jgi:haloalkane dehalogenase
MENQAGDSAVPIRSRYVEIDGSKCHYFDEGEGPLILCLHPGPGTCLFYKRLITQLRDRYRVVAPDFPGFGQSDGPDEFSLLHLRGFVLRFMEELGLEQVTLLVNDTSGAVGIGAATDAPERVTALIITDTLAFPLTGRLLPARLVLRYVIPFFKYPNRWFNIFPWIVATLGCVWNPLRGQERKDYVQAFRTARQRDRIIDWVREFGKNNEYLEELERSIRDKLSEHRSLIIFGQFDPMRILGAHRRFQKLLTNSEVHLIPWEAHFPVLGSTDRVATVIEQWFEDPNGEKEDTPH